MDFDLRCSFGSSCTAQQQSRGQFVGPPAAPRPAQQQSLILLPLALPLHKGFVRGDNDASIFLTDTTFLPSGPESVVVNRPQTDTHALHRHADWLLRHLISIVARQLDGRLAVIFANKTHTPQQPNRRKVQQTFH